MTWTRPDSGDSSEERDRWTPAPICRFELIVDSVCVLQERFCKSFPDCIGVERIHELGAASGKEWCKDSVDYVVDIVERQHM
jgi:hypothetical protein